MVKKHIHTLQNGLVSKGIITHQKLLVYYLTYHI
jgi:hypothetical protein